MRAMSETTNNTPNTTAADELDELDGQSVIAVSFEDDGNAYKALTSLRP